MREEKDNNGSPTSRPWPSQTNQVEIGLNLVLVAILKGEPSIWIQQSSENLDGLPYGPYNSLDHKTMALSAIDLAAKNTALSTGHIEQLYTFGDQGRVEGNGENDRSFVSVGYLGLCKVGESKVDPQKWKSWYAFFPWEDWRKGTPAILKDTILPAMEAWLLEKNTKPEFQHLKSVARVNTAFGTGGELWNDELVLERYELLFAAGLVQEAGRGQKELGGSNQLGKEMVHDHRRILATAISRLRGKLKYRPVAFELMDDEFSLLQLQNGVEAVTGKTVHKQNFRRSVEKANLLQATGTTSLAAGGRPAALFRFKREVIAEYASLGLKIGRL